MEWDGQLGMDLFGLEQRLSTCHGENGTEHAGSISYLNILST